MRIKGTTKAGAVANFAAAFAVLGSGTNAQAADSWTANEDDALLLQVHVGNFRMEGDIRGYRTDRGVCVDFGDVIQVLDLPIRLDKKSRRATGWLFAEERTFTIDRDSNMVQIVNKGENLASGEIYDTPEGWCVDTKAMARWFGVRLTADPFNLLVKLDSDEKLPFIEAIERRSRAARLRPKREQFDLSKLPQADMPYKAWRTPAVDMVVNFNVTDNPDGATRADLRYELFASGEIAGTSVDARLASDREGVPESLRVRAFRYDPEGGLLGPLKATKVAIGDVETGIGSLVGRSGVGRGVSISNKPLQRESSFSKTTIRGAMPAGWDAELYRNGQLIAFQGDSSDGRYEFFDVDLLYGNNDFEVVLYGPQGQVRREASSTPVGIQSISPGKTQYWASIIEQGHNLLDFGREIIDPNTGWRWGVGVERGIDDRTMAAVTAQGMSVRGNRYNFVEGNLRRALGPMLVELSVANSLGQGTAIRAQALGKVGKVNFEAQTLWISGDFESDVVDPYIRSEQSLRFDTSLKLGKIRAPVQAGYRRETWKDGTKVNEWLLRGSMITRGLSVTAELGRTTIDRPYGPKQTTDDETRLNLLANTRLGDVRLRGEARFRLSGYRAGLASATFVAEKPLTEKSDLRFEIQHFNDFRRTDFGLGYIREFKRFSLQAEGRIGSDGALGFGLSLAMSMGPDPVNGGVRFSHEKLAQTGQASVLVFRDEDGDGRRSPGEEPIEGVSIEAGFRASDTPTDDKGHAIVEGLRPYVPVLVTIDTGSLPDPFLQPQGKGIVVTPRPGIATMIELPLSPTGEIEGVINGLSGTPRPGVELELVDALGSVVATRVSEFDGFFLFDQIAYGRYSLRVSERSARALEVEQALAGGIVLSNDAALVRLGAIKLEPSRIAAASGANKESGEL